MYVFTVLSTTSVRGSYWIDLRELTSSVPGTWEWGDGTPLHYPSTDPWIPGEPNKASYVRAALSKSTTRLSDTPSTSTKHFICEKWRMNKVNFFHATLCLIFQSRKFSLKQYNNILFIHFFFNNLTILVNIEHWSWSLCFYQMSEKLNQWLNESVTQWINDSMNQWLNDTSGKKL